ncbi:MAG: asparagine synthase (glutamine-hydrolyzing), partial [Pseudomonadota bacterium]
GVLSFNGEIYNFKDLRTTFNQTTFRTRSDTEVLAEGFATRGFDFISSVNGMFAFAYWDRDEKTLTLARDRFGEKPLYYTETRDGLFLFASELKALVASGLIDTEINDEAFYDYLVFGFVPDPKSIYKDVYKLRAGERVVVRHGGKRTTERYWRATKTLLDGLSVDDAPLPIEDAATALLDSFDRAVLQQTVSDVPISAFLSGGVDSSAIVASMSSSGLIPSVCSVGFDQSSNNDMPYAKKVAAQYDVNLHEETISIDSVSQIPKIAATFDEPFADSSALPTFAVSSVAKRYATVALSGDGADELFAGYRRYPMISAEMRVRDHIPAALRTSIIKPLSEIVPKADWAPRFFRAKSTLQSLSLSHSEAYLRAIAINVPERMYALLSDDYHHSRGHYSPTDLISQALTDLPPGLVSDPVRFAQAIDFETWLPGRMLTKVDRTSMANSLEVRVPFLDHTLASWVNALPTQYKLTNGTGKYLLKRSQANRLSKDILFRPKQGFGLPLQSWMRDDNGPIEFLKERLSNSSDTRFSRKRVAQAIDQHQAGRADLSQELWTVIMWYAFREQMA